MCRFSNSTFPQPSPNAPKTPPFPPNFTLDLKKCFVLSRERPTLFPVFPCQVIFLPRSSQVLDSKPNRVSAQVRGSPPPICYPEYRPAVFQAGRPESGWPTSARVLGECGSAASHGRCGLFCLACLSFNPCIFKFLPGNIGGEGGPPILASFQTCQAHNLRKCP